MAKIAVQKSSSHPTLIRTAEREPQKSRLLGSGDGWSIYNVVCTAGPQDLPFEEQHSQMSVAVVLSGSFQYRTSTGSELMTPGSLLLGNPLDTFECSHEHGVGDRCIAFHYSQEFCERAHMSSTAEFRVPRIPALRTLSPIVARAAALLRSEVDPNCLEETACQILDRATQLQHGLANRRSLDTAESLARVTRVLRRIESHPEDPHDLSELAADARLSPYHFVRCFESLTGTTPHQFVLRTRLRRAAMRLRQESTRIIEIALGCGFGDVSNFNRTFRAEFGESPRSYRRTATKA